MKNNTNSDVKNIANIMLAEAKAISELCENNLPVYMAKIDISVILRYATDYEYIWMLHSTGAYLVILDSRYISSIELNSLKGIEYNSTFYYHISKENISKIDRDAALELTIKCMNKTKYIGNLK